jgi:hypothetical protein
MSPRWFIPCFIFLLLLGGAWRLCCDDAQAAQRSAASIQTAETTLKTERRSERFEAFSVDSGPHEISAQKTTTVATPIARISAGTAAVLAEEIELRTLGEPLKLSLTAQQWAAFAEVTLYAQAVRHVYEAEIAVMRPTEDGRQRVEIPVYAAAGDALRGELYSALRRELGPGVAGEVICKFKHGLEARFAGFGVSTQTLDFAADEEGKIGDGAVTRTVVFARSTDAGGDQPTMRCETSFPRLEDPEGLQWGPLLARLEGPLKKKSGG